jgi:hypothetical protein
MRAKSEEGRGLTRGFRYRLHRNGRYYHVSQR